MIDMGIFAFFYMLTSSFFPAPFVEDALFFPMYNFGFFVKNQVFISVWINVRVFSLIPLIHVFVFMPIPTVFITIVLEWSLKSRKVMSLEFLHCTDCFGYLVFFFFFKFILFYFIGLS